MTVEVVAEGSSCGDATAANQTTIIADVADVQTDTTAIIADIATVQVGVTAIAAVTAALSVLTETGGTLTTDGTEQDIYINNAPAGVYRPIGINIDFSAQTATETVVLKVYYRNASGGGLVAHDTETYTGALDPDVVVIDLDPNRYGVEVTIEKTGGTNRAYPWEVFYET